MNFRRAEALRQLAHKQKTIPQRLGSNTNLIPNAPFYLHIPKTGGTALKSYILDHPHCNLNVRYAQHRVTLATCPQNAIFFIRDPLERFCSGYWTAKNRLIRNELAAKPENVKYKHHPNSVKYSSNEERLFNAGPTPNLLLTKIRTNQDLLAIFNKSSPYSNLEEMTRSITFWLGTLEKYQKVEEKIKLVCDLDNMERILKEEFAIDLSGLTDFQKRSKKQFNIEQSYEVSAENAEWFKTVFRAADYELLEYIRSRPYYKT